MELSMDTKYVVQESRIWNSGILDGVKRCFESGKCAMGAKSVFSTSMIEEMGYVFLFQDGQVLFMSGGSSSYIIVVLELERASCIRRRVSLCRP